LNPLEHVELATGPEPRGTVIWMHGLGADGWDFVPLVRELPLPESLTLRFVFPHAPARPVTINNGFVMRAWYDISQSDIARVPDEKGIRESQAAVEQLIAREKSRGIDPSAIVLAGFSQGGAIALQTGLRLRERLDLAAGAAHARVQRRVAQLRDAALGAPGRGAGPRRVPGAGLRCCAGEVFDTAR